MGAYASADDLTTRLALDGYSSALTADQKEALLSEAAVAIDGYCRHDFLDHSGASVTVLGNGMDRLLLPVRPLRSVSAATVDGDPLDAADLAGLQVASYGLVAGYYFPKGVDCLFTCTWGYSAIPEAVRRACLILASRYVRHRGIREKVAEGLRSQSVEGVSVSLDALAMDRDVAQLLDTYVWRRAAR